MQIKLFTGQEDDRLELQVNAWLQANSTVEIVKTHFQAAAGGDFSYSSYCIEYREAKPECVETFVSEQIAYLENSVNVWLKDRVGEIEIIERKFAMCTIGDSDYPQERNPQYGYCIVYREK